MTRSLRNSIEHLFADESEHAVQMLKSLGDWGSARVTLTCDKLLFASHGSLERLNCLVARAKVPDELHVYLGRVDHWRSVCESIGMHPVEWYHSLAMAIRPIAGALAEYRCSSITSHGTVCVTGEHRDAYLSPKFFLAPIHEGGFFISFQDFRDEPKTREGMQDQPGEWADGEAGSGRILYHVSHTFEHDCPI